MEIISGKSSMKQTNIAIKPMTADSPAEYPMMTPLWVGEKGSAGEPLKSSSQLLEEQTIRARFCLIQSPL